MIIFICSCLMVTFLLACLAVAVGKSMGRKRRASRERFLVDLQALRAERKLHDLASDTFSRMMGAARKASGGCQWHR